MIWRVVLRGDPGIDGGVGRVGVQARGQGPAAAPGPGGVVDTGRGAEGSPAPGRHQGKGDGQVRGRVADAEPAEVDDRAETAVDGQQIAGVEVAVEPAGDSFMACPPCRQEQLLWWARSMRRAVGAIKVPRRLACRSVFPGWPSSARYADGNAPKRELAANHAPDTLRAGPWLRKLRTC